MIKNLLLALGLSILPIQTTIYGTSSILVNSEPTNKTNTYEDTRIENNELVEATEIATINFDEQIKTNLTYKQRAIITTYRDIGANDYVIKYSLLISIDTALDREEQPTTIQLILEPPLNSYIVEKELTYYRYSSLTTIQNNFINGANYNNYSELNSLKTALQVGQTEEGNETGFNDYISIETSNYDFLRFDFYLEYNPSYINNNGTTLLNNIKTISRTSTEIQYSYSYDSSTYEVIDLPGLMFDILGMPFAWLSIAFNFTLFEGTPYAINISTLLLGLLVSLIALIIFRIIMKGS